MFLYFSKKTVILIDGLLMGFSGLINQNGNKSLLKCSKSRRTPEASTGCKAHIQNVIFVSDDQTFGRFGPFPHEPPEAENQPVFDFRIHQCEKKSGPSWSLHAEPVPMKHTNQPLYIYRIFISLLIKNIKPDTF